MSVEASPEAEPPRGAPWDRRLAEAPLVWLDLEMTGTDPASDRICELAAIRVEGGREVARLVSLVQAAPVGASALIHGIADEDLAGAPPLDALRSRLDDILEGAVVVGHRIGFDLAFLASAAERGQLTAPPAFALDTRALARRVWHRSTYGLAALCEGLTEPSGEPLPRPSHRAEPDARAAGALLRVLRRELRAQTPRQLWQAQQRSGSKRFREDVERVLTEAAAVGRRVRFAYRVPGRAAVEDELEIHRLRPPHVEGRLTSRGVTRTLRGDRVLWAERS